MEKIICLNGAYSTIDFASNILNNRMFRYADGFFETIVYKENKIQLWNFHLTRIRKSFDVLHFQLLNFEALEQHILYLIEHHKSTESRINIYFWRKDGGLYTPFSNEVNYLIVSETLILKNEPIGNYGFANTIYNSFNPYSFFKTNSLKYVLAGIEKQEQQWDEIILLDSDKNISEGLSSNIFWIKNSIYYTPSLETGCVEGVFRNYLIEKLQLEGTTVEQGKWKKETLLDTDKIFLTNCLGIRELPLHKK